MLLINMLSAFAMVRLIEVKSDMWSKNYEVWRIKCELWTVKCKL